MSQSEIVKVLDEFRRMEHDGKNRIYVTYRMLYRALAHRATSSLNQNLAKLVKHGEVELIFVVFPDRFGRERLYKAVRLK